MGAPRRAFERDAHLYNVVIVLHIALEKAKKKMGMIFYFS
jgi:hypothetical protein